MKALVLDVETTGLLLPELAVSAQPRIIEIGALLLDAVTCDTFDVYASLVHPGERITEEITKITGITNENVKDAPRIDKHIEPLRKLFAQAQMLVAHNLPFDKGVLCAELARVEYARNDHTLGEWPWPEIEICTVQAYMHEWGRRMKLTELYERKMKRPLAQTHRALDDVNALVEVLKQDGTLKVFV